MSTVDRFAEGYEPRFDIDDEVGRQGALFVADVADAIREAVSSGSGEVKTDMKSVHTGNVYIEYECLYRTGWKPSGIAITEAAIWHHVLPGPVLIAAPVDRVREVVARYRREPRNLRDCTRGSHPTHGVVVPVQAFVHWLIDRRVA